ncbi:MAG: hypothetical protein ABL964_12915 [Steroidobacteraceae bacterium]
MKHSPSPVAYGALLAICGTLFMQSANAGQAPAAPQTPKAAAPVDLTGQWVSVITEDWRWRMVTPLKGDFANIPVNAAAKAVGEQWDPARDEAQGEQCKGYGALAIMREPGRFRVSWQDDTTLKIETDSGAQTRLLHFAGAPSGGERQLQGYSQAQWQPGPGGRGPFGRGGFGIGIVRVGNQSNSLEVATSQIRPGYLRKNGIPFSEDAKLTEYFDVVREPSGQEWLVITSIVEDPKYLNEPWVTSINLKKEKDADRSKWQPTPCSAR